MDELSDAAIVETLRRQLTIAATKQGVAASNLANVSTPGYRAREVRSEFSDLIDKELASAATMTATHPEHQSAGESAVAVEEREGFAAQRDGNNVQIDRELLTMTAASGEFARAQTVLSAKFRLVRYAINEGR